MKMSLSSRMPSSPHMICGTICDNPCNITSYPENVIAHGLLDQTNTPNRDTSMSYSGYLYFLMLVNKPI